MASVSVVTAPAPVVTVDDAKAHLRVDFIDDDDLIEALVATATEWLDAPRGWLGRAVGRQVLEATVDGFPSCGLALPFPPFHELVEVCFVDPSGVEQVADLADFRVTGGADRPLLLPARGLRFPATSAGPDAVTVRWSCGWEAAAVPKPIRQAMLLLIGHFYETREATTAQPLHALPMGVDALLSTFRIYGHGAEGWG